MRTCFQPSCFLRLLHINHCPPSPAQGAMTPAHAMPGILSDQRAGITGNVRGQSTGITACVALFLSSCVSKDSEPSDMRSSGQPWLPLAWLCRYIWTHKAGCARRYALSPVPSATSSKRTRLLSSRHLFPTSLCYFKYCCIAYGELSSMPSHRKGSRQTRAATNGYRI